MRMVGKIMALNVEKIYASEEQVSKLSAMQNAMKPLERYASLYARTEILCAYTISRFGSNVPHALMDHIESMYLKKKNHDLPATDTGISHPILFIPQLTSISEVIKWYRRRFDTTTEASCTPFTKFCRR